MNKILLASLMMLLMFNGFSQDKTNSLKTSFLNRTPGYSKSVKITANGITTIYISGLTGDGKTFAEQTLNAFKNINAELMANNASVKHIVKMNTYIVNLNQQYVDTFRSVRKEFFGIKDLSKDNDGMPASTIVGISALAEKGKMIEIEAIVVMEEVKMLNPNIAPEPK